MADKNIVHYQSVAIVGKEHQQKFIRSVNGSVLLIGLHGDYYTAN